MTEELAAAQHSDQGEAGRLSKHAVKAGLAGTERRRYARAPPRCTGNSESYRQAIDGMTVQRAKGKEQRAVVLLSLRGLREAWWGIAPVKA